MNLALREALRAFSRAPMLSALSVTTIAFSLFAFGLFGLVALNLRAALAQVEERVEVRAFIAEGTNPEATAASVGDIATFPEVSNVRMVSEVQALERARRELGEFEDVFEAGILPASIEVRLKDGFRDPESVRTVATRLEVYDFIDDIRYGEEWVEKLYKLRNIATAAGVSLGLTFALVAIIIIGSTIRMAVLARAREIHIMRLVGATNGFTKSASYLMHLPEFSVIRDYLLNNCRTMTQDDSGIPWRDFPRDRWNVQAFGWYPGPIDLFKQHFQPDLAEYYRNNEVAMIPFGIGYQWRPKQSTLIYGVSKMVVRKAIPVVEETPSR